MTETVYDAVKDSFGIISLDNVQPELLGYSLKLYALVRPTPFSAQDTRLHTYKKGFSRLLQGRFAEAQQHFVEYLQDPEPEGDVVPHAKRLLRVAIQKQRKLCKNRVFCRSDGWENDSGESSDGLSSPHHNSLSRLDRPTSDDSETSNAALHRCSTVMGKAAWSPVRLPAYGASAPVMMDPLKANASPRRHTICSQPSRQRWGSPGFPRSKSVDAEPETRLFLPIPVTKTPPLASPMNRSRY